MSRRRFVALAGLLTGLLIVPGELGPVLGYGGSDHFGVVDAVLVVDPTGVADVGARARNARSYLPENDPVIGYAANIPPKTDNNIFGEPNAVDALFLQKIYAKVDSDNGGTVANASGRPSVLTPAVSSKARMLHSRAKSTLRPEGCAQCGEVVRATGGRTKTLAALISRAFSGKGGPVRPHHPVAGIGQQREAAFLTASTIPRGWRIPSL